MYVFNLRLNLIFLQSPEVKIPEILPLIFELLLVDGEVEYIPPVINTTVANVTDDSLEYDYDDDGEEEEEEEKSDCGMRIRVVKDMIFFLSHEANIKPFLSQVCRLCETEIQLLVAMV